MPTSTVSSGKSLPIRVAVVAAGVFSPLGFGLPETLNALRSARDCVSPVTRFAVEGCRCQTAGQVPDERLESGNGRHEKRLHRASRMMIAALREALTQDRQFKPQLTVIGTTSGGKGYWGKFSRAAEQPTDPRGAPPTVAT